MCPGCHLGRKWVHKSAFTLNCAGNMGVVCGNSFKGTGGFWSPHLFL